MHHELALSFLACSGGSVMVYRTLSARAFTDDIQSFRHSSVVSVYQYSANVHGVSYSKCVSCAEIKPMHHRYHRRQCSLTSFQRLASTTTAMAPLISFKAGRCERRPGTNWVDPQPAKGCAHTSTTSTSCRVVSMDIADTDRFMQPGVARAI